MFQPKEGSILIKFPERGGTPLALFNASSDQEIEALRKWFSQNFGGAVPRDLAESPDLSDPPTSSGEDLQIEQSS